MKVLVNELLKAINGCVIGDDSILGKEITGVSIDSREELSGKLFIPIIGDNFDGHEFIQNANKKGAVCCISEKTLNVDFTYIKVDSTKVALLDFAEYYRSLFNIKVVAVTGSTGKTTTKDMIYSILSKKYKTLKTEGNFNNEIGLPLTVFRLDETIEVAVLEMGMNNFGEIHNLSKVAKPSICVITNIGVSHIENLGSREGILKAKTEIFDNMSKDAIIILNGDDDMLKTLKDTKNNIFYFGIGNDNNFTVDSIVYNGIEGTDFVLHLDDQKIYINRNKPGQHMVINALGAATVGHVLSLTDAQIKMGIENFELSKMRMDIIKTDKYIIINDVYNANPDSMKAAIDLLAKSEGNKVCILGDMLELGEKSTEMHYEIGDYAFNKAINVIVCVGKKAYSIYEGASRSIVDSDTSSRAIYMDSQEMLFENFPNILSNADVILVKASRGMHFENIIEKLKR